jgi:hypothetical protein
MWNLKYGLLTAKLAVPDREAKQLVGYADYQFMNEELFCLLILPSLLGGRGEAFYSFLFSFSMLSRFVRELLSRGILC